jgi:hypothetical protein
LSRDPYMLVSNIATTHNAYLLLLTIGNKRK